MVTPSLDMFFIAWQLLILKTVERTIHVTDLDPRLLRWGSAFCPSRALGAVPWL
jgi:hypothetical protein